MRSSMGGRAARGSIRASACIAAAVGTLIGGGCNTAGQGAFSGAAIGALAGMGLGSLRGDMGEGAAAGAILGGVFGGVLGDQNERASWRRGGYEPRSGDGWGRRGDGWYADSWHSHHYHDRCRGW